MVKKSKLAFILGIIVIIIFLVVTVLLVVALGFGDKKERLIIVSASTEKTYDGTPLTDAGWSIAKGKLAENHTLEVIVYGSITDVGEAENIFSIKITDQNAKNVTHSYEIERAAGILKVHGRPLYIRSASATKVYDGKPLSNSEWELVWGTLVNDHTLEVNVSNEYVDAGAHPNTMDAIIKDNDNNVTHNYNITYDTGTIDIQPRVITIYTESETKYYDDSPLTNDGWSMVGTLVEGHREEVKVLGYGLDAGYYNNIFTANIIDDSGKNMSHNYHIIHMEGSLIILPREITIRSEGASKRYDGEPLTNPNWEVVSANDVVGGHALSVTISGTQTVTGQSPNIIASVVIRKQAKNISYNYTVTLQEDPLIVFGSLTGSEIGDLDNSGKIGNDGGGGEEKVALRVKSNLDGEMYLRYLSYGDYTGTKWSAAKDYSKFIDGNYSLNYLNGLVLGSVGYTKDIATIESYTNNYLLPYYLSPESNDYTIQLSDVEYYGDTSLPYAVNYYQYDYLSTELYGSLPYQYTALERDYYDYVKSNYLAIPQSSYDFFINIANSFNSGSPYLIASIAQYIQNSATYDIDYDRNMDKELDISRSFLDTYRSGICSHFASAATLLYRAMGIPARYTTGYVGTTKNGEWIEITTASAHAWVEVYISGLGWVSIEVTPGGVGGGGQIDDESKNIVIKPADKYMVYTGGAMLEAANNELQGAGLLSLLNQGYYYVATVEGRITSVGKVASRITSFVLYEPFGEDVTDEYNITFKEGVLQLYLYELTVTTVSLSKTYDGEPLLGQVYPSISGIQSGHTVKQIVYNGSQTNVGKSDNSCAVIIENDYGFDVTDSYKLNGEFGTLTVLSREITLTAGSAQKSYDGTPLVFNNYFLTSSLAEPLAAGDIIIVRIEGSVTERGEVSNVIIDAVILNSKGEVVTGNYAIAFEDGTLSVTN